MIILNSITKVIHALISCITYDDSRIPPKVVNLQTTIVIQYIEAILDVAWAPRKKDNSQRKKMLNHKKDELKKEYKVDIINKDLKGILHNNPRYSTLL